MLSATAVKNARHVSRRHAQRQNYWRMKYRIGKQEKRLSIGVHPTVSLKRALQIREQARQQTLDNIDPSALKQAKKLTSETAPENNFKVVALEWFARQKPIRLIFNKLMTAGR